MDQVLERWLNERGIPDFALQLVGAEYSEGVIRFPRHDIRSGDVVGWKCRDLSSGRFWGEPSGIAHADTRPLIVEDVLPATGAMICEGESDTMRLACTDLPGLYSSDVICIPGANAFPAQWVPMLRRYERVHVFADADEAGGALPARLGQLVPGVRVVRLPDGDDVCSFLLTHTEEDLVRLYSIAPLHISANPGPLRRSSFSWDDAAADGHRDKLTRIVSQDIELKRRGSEFIGLCPFHNENTPSFSVNAQKGLYRCFGCDAKGDIVTYLKEKRGMSFGEAMRYLEDYR